jgi:hypothetical protein
MVLNIKTKVLQSPNSRTQYITIPAAMVTDSQYPLKPDQEVEIIVNKEEDKLEIVPLRYKTETKPRQVIR